MIHSSNGFGSSSKIPGVNAPTNQGLGAVQGDASSAPLNAILLAAVVLLIGGYAGMQAWKVGKGRRVTGDGRG